MASPPITKSRCGEAGDHRHVAGAVAGRVGEADRAVAEEVEGAAEGRVGVDPAAVEVDRAVVEGVVEVGAAVAAQQRARAAWSPPPTPCSLTTKGELGNSEIAEVWSTCRWVITTTAISPGLEAALAQLGRRRPRPARPAVVPGARGGRSSRAGSAAIEGCRPVSTRIAPGARVADQEGGAGDRSSPACR